MCVIATSAKGFDVPAKPVMKDMYDYNPDGAGFAYALNKRVYIEKGFMNYEDYDKALTALETKLKTRYNKTLKDISIMFHFRIGTHGPNSPQLTHPFPITHKKKHFDALDLHTDVVMAHNGIIKSVVPNTDWSDTTQYVKDVLYPLYLHDKAFYQSEHIRSMIDNTINGSRFVFLDKFGEFTYIGDWKNSDKEELKGVKFSNLNHEDMYLTKYYSNAFNYRTYRWAKKGVMFLKELPVGTILANDNDFDRDFMLKPDASFKILDSTDMIKYYVDEVGEVYHSIGKGSNVMKNYRFDIAFFDYSKPEEFNFLTSDSLDLIAIPLKEYELHGYAAEEFEDTYSIG
jgi:predicted glutamine amidotransferase